MGENRDITPEKQLLKLIEGSDDGSLKTAQLQHKGHGFKSLEALRGAFFGRFSFFKRSAKENIHSAYRLKVSFGAINKALFAVVITLFVYLVATTMASAVHLKQLPNFAPDAGKEVALNPKDTAAMRDESYYLERVNARDLFNEVRPAEDETKPQTVSVQENEAAKNLSLVGISWSQNPDAIIEDKTLQRTYFLKKGQTVGNGFVVFEIYKDKVVLSQGNKRYELR